MNIIDYGIPFMISFSGGRTSAYMTYILLQNEFIKTNSVVCFANTGKENEATLQFVKDCQDHWDIEIVWLEYDLETKYRIVNFETANREGKPFADLISKRNYLPNVVTRFCTQDLKIRLFKYYMQDLGFKHWTNIIGIRYDEPRRYYKLINNSKERWNNYMPLFDLKITKKDISCFWNNMNFQLKIKDYEGNCDLCFLKSIKKKKEIIRNSPEKVEWWIKQENIVNATFVKDFSYTQLRTLIEQRYDLFEHSNDIDIECFCNVD